MMSDIDYLPHMNFRGFRHDVVSIGYCVDFGGRQADIEFQYKIEGSYKRPIYTYYPLEKKWCNDSIPTDNHLTKVIHDSFVLFDTTGKLDLPCDEVSAIINKEGEK